MITENEVYELCGSDEGHTDSDKAYDGTSRESMALSLCRESRRAC